MDAASHRRETPLYALPGQWEQSVCALQIAGCLWSLTHPSMRWTDAPLIERDALRDKAEGIVTEYLTGRNR